MRNYTFFLLAAFAFFTFSCSTSGKVGKDLLSSNSWELEFLTGTNDTLETLFPTGKPVVTFDTESSSVNGTTGCNGYQASFKMKDKNIAFEEPGLATLRYCGDGELLFKKAMQDISAYQITTEGKLELLMYDTVMMRFKKVSK